MDVPQPPYCRERKYNHSYPLQTSEQKLGRLFSVGETQFLTNAVYSAERETTGRQKVSGHSYDASYYIDFTIRYLNNTLSNMSNMHIWGYSENKLCVLCHQVQTLGHVVAGCNVSLTVCQYT